MLLDRPASFVFIIIASPVNLVFVGETPGPAGMCHVTEELPRRLPCRKDIQSMAEDTPAFCGRHRVPGMPV
jgi:hypothetical protein